MDDILDIQLKRVRRLLADREMSLEITQAARKVIADIGYDPAFGARPLKRAIQAHLMNPMSRAIIAGGYGPRDGIKVDVEEEDGKKFITFERIPAEVEDDELEMKVPPPPAPTEEAPTTA